MGLRYALRELWYHRLRTGLALLGVAVSTAMLVDMLMLGGGLEKSFEELLSSRGYGLRLAPKGTLPFDTEALIPEYGSLRDSVLDLPGVEGVAPILAANLSLRPSRSPADRVQAFAIGIDPREQGILRMTEGVPPDGRAVVLETDLARDLGLAAGDAVTLSLTGPLGVDLRAEELRVSGLAEFIYASSEERSIALELSVLQRLTGRGDSISFAMVRAAPDADPADVRAAIQTTVPRVEAVTIEGLVEQAQARLSYFRQLAWILGTVAVVVTALLVGT
ncbi:MAG: ABC transporter permease, partial [Gemmatimonadota bacterium]|nr:ABC transporter permease [Gemmatimonadota bacterium]